jgi:hypothetical protein
MIKHIKSLALLFLLPAFSYAQVIIEGDGEIVAKGTANIILKGDFTNNNTSGAGSGFTGSSSAKVYFKGTAIQTIGGSNDYTIFTNADLDNASGVSLSKIAAFSNFTFINGKVTSSNSAPFYILDGGSVSGASSSRFVNGPMSKVGDTNFKFDIGDGNKYAPLELSSITRNTTIGVTYHQSAPNNKSNLTAPLVKVSDVEYWVIDDVLGGGLSPSASANIKLHWENASESGIKSLDSDSLKFAWYDGSSWQPIDGSITGSTGSGSGSIQASSAVKLDNANVTFGSTNKTTNPLPIQLLSFTAQCSDNDVLIEWSTATEENNDYFTILRSDDNEHYEDIIQLVGAGNSNNIINYSYTDYNAKDGNFYYKLKQTDYDGKNEVFSPVHVNCYIKKELSLNIFYDGIQPYALLSNAESGSRYNMMIVDHMGRVVVQEKQSVNNQNYYRIPLQLASGPYSIVYYSDNGAIRLNERFFIR